MKIKQILMMLPVLLASVAGALQDKEPRTPLVVISQDVAEKLLLRKVEPAYPESVKAKHVAGQIVVWMIIDEQGNVTQAVSVGQDLANHKSINADDLHLRDAAEKAVKQWQYQPYRITSGEAVEVGTSVVLRFDFAGQQTSADSPPPTSEKTDIDPKIAEANKVYDVPPDYPQMARIAHIQGDVLLRAVIGKRGDLENLRAISGHPILIQAALDAVRQRKYRPFMINGEIVAVETVIKVEFRL